MADVLISPLGRSPGAVSGVYFALKEKGILVQQVVTVGTSHHEVRAAANNYLKPIFEQIKVGYDPIHIPALELKHGRGSINVFVAMVELALENAHKDGHRVHVAVTGGRSGMGALAALATNLYGANHLWHLWVRQDIEEGGAIDKLVWLVDPAEMIISPYLNPTVEEQACELVDLPFLDLRPLHEMLWAYKRTGEVPNLSSPLARLFAHSEIRQFRDIFPAGLTFAQADYILELKAAYVQATPQEYAKVMTELGIILQQAGIVEEKERQILRDLVTGQAAPEALFDLAQKVRKDRKGFWQWLLNNKDGVGVTLGIAGTSTGILGLLLNALELYLKVKGYLP